LLEKNIDKICWSCLLDNSNANYLIKQNINKITGKWTLHNPNIFEIDKMRLNRDIHEQVQKLKINYLIY